MKMNEKMSSLLQRATVSWPLASDAIMVEIPKLEPIHDCFLLKSEYERNKHVRIADFSDKTGFECFINHVHLPFSGTTESLTSCLGYAAALRTALTFVAEDRRFRVIVGIADRDCTVRFHQIRVGENWIAEDLEGYRSEAILVFDVPS